MKHEPQKIYDEEIRYFEADSPTEVCLSGTGCVAFEAEGGLSSLLQKSRRLYEFHNITALDGAHSSKMYSSFEA